MTPAEYLSRERFPLTARPGLTLRQQALIDAFNRDALRAHVAEGNEPSDGDRDRLAELEVKAAARAGWGEPPGPP